MTIAKLIVANLSTELWVKFDFTAKVQSLTNDKFEIWTTGATPGQLSSPFRTIDTFNDYNSISRVLKLYLTTALAGVTEYQLRVAGLLNATSITMPDQSIDFTTDVMPGPIVEPEPEVVNVIDHSVRTGAAVDPTEEGPFFSFAGTGLLIEDTDPANGDAYIDVDYNDGRAIIKFSSAPAPGFLNSTYFKVQKKKITRSVSRWSAVAAQISASPSDPWVYVDFPSTDATPVYHQADKTYFELATKYRIRVPKTVGT